MSVRTTKPMKTEILDLLANYTSGSPCRPRSDYGPMNVPFLLWKLLDPATQKTIQTSRDQNDRGIQGYRYEEWREQKRLLGIKEAAKESIPRQYPKTDRMASKTERRGRAKQVQEPRNRQEEGQRKTRTNLTILRILRFPVKGDHWAVLRRDRTQDIYLMVKTQRGRRRASRIHAWWLYKCWGAHRSSMVLIARLVRARTIISTTDNGADTCRWQRLEQFSYRPAGRKANLVGFDSNFARKERKHIVAADTVVMMESKKEIIIRAHETVYNENSPTTLISSSKVRSWPCDRLSSQNHV
jgi:hypothetical protein